MILNKLKTNTTMTKIRKEIDYTKTASRPIGYSLPWQAQELEVSHTASFGQIEPCNLYLTAIAKAVQEFVVEECSGNSYSEQRLMNKIEAARLLFGDERQSLKAIRGIKF